MNVLPCGGAGEMTFVGVTAVSDTKRCHYNIRSININTSIQVNVVTTFYTFQDIICFV